MSTTIPQKSIATYWPANKSIRNRVINGAIKVARAVSVTDSATFARAKYDITLDASPLGQLLINITPAAISGGNVNTFVNAQPVKGMMVYWQTIPTTTPFGICMTRAKSFILN